MAFGPMHGLKLSEAQHDKLFAIMHAQAPQHYENEKAIRKAHEGLHELAHSGKFDDAKAGALARDLGQAVAAEALLQARTAAQALAVLTPEQREQLRQHHAHGPWQHRRDGDERPDGAPDPR
jgi:Spy/CpxP family protein refolding chaperone